MKKKHFQILNSNTNSNLHWWFYGRSLWINKILDKVLNKKNYKILEIGCGSGVNFSSLSEYGKVVGIEPNKYICKKNSKGNILNENIEQHSIKNKYDIICMFDVLEHIKKDNEIINKIYKNHLKKRGFLFIICPAFNLLYSHEDKSLGHYRRYNVNTLTKILEENNFKTLTRGYFYSFLVPLLFILKIIQFKGNVRSKTFKDNKYLSNIIFRLAIKIEILVSSIIKIPFGSSVFVVAKKN